MTRLERAALDYVIAELANGFWPETIGVEYSLGPDASDATSIALNARDTVDSRVVEARLALYLRLLRRVEAWESRTFSDRPDWTCPRYQAPRNDGTWVTGDRMQHETWFGGYMEDCRLAPWRPLWLDAPPYDPAVTPRMRREGKR